MRTISRSLVLIMVLSVFTQLFALDIKIKAGFNSANMLEKNSSTTISENYSPKNSFHIGVAGEIPVNEYLSVDAGLIMSGKGYHEIIEGSLLVDDYHEVTDIFYLDIPVLAKAKISFSELDLFATLGPYVGIGLWGSTKIETEVLGVSVTDTVKVEWGSDYDEYKTIDLGLSMGVGLAYSSFELGLSYQMGLISTSGVTTDDYIRKNRVLAVCLGYVINKK